MIQVPFLSSPPTFVLQIEFHLILIYSIFRLLLNFYPNLFISLILIFPCIFRFNTFEATRYFCFRWKQHFNHTQQNTIHSYTTGHKKQFTPIKKHPKTYKPTTNKNTFTRKKEKTRKLDNCQFKRNCSDKSNDTRHIIEFGGADNLIAI